MHGNGLAHSVKPPSLHLANTVAATAIDATSAIENLATTLIEEIATSDSAVPTMPALSASLIPTIGSHATPAGLFVNTGLKSVSSMTRRQIRAELRELGILQVGGKEEMAHRLARARTGDVTCQRSYVCGISPCFEARRLWFVQTARYQIREPPVPRRHPASAVALATRQTAKVAKKPKAVGGLQATG